MYVPGDCVSHSLLLGSLSCFAGLWVFTLMSYCFDYHGFKVSFEICKCDALVLFFLRITSAFQGILKINFRIFFYFYVNFQWNFDRAYIEFVDHFDSMHSLVILIFPINEHGISFYLFVSSSISFITLYTVFVYSFLVKFISKYFIALGTVVHGVVFFISFSESLMVVYKNTTDFICLSYTLELSLLVLPVFWWNR